MTTVYLYDPTTRKPSGVRVCQNDPKTGELLRPRFSVDTAPPVFPDFVEVLAGYNVWYADIERTRDNALALTEDMHDQTLVGMTGDHSTVEMQTWHAKGPAARALLNKTALPSQIEMIELIAGPKGMSNEILSEYIVKKADAYEILIGRADGFRSTVRDALKEAEDVESIIAIIEQAKLKVMAFQSGQA
jgi:hypothetical protein